MCIRRTNVSSWDFVAYVCFRPMFNLERLLHSLVTKSAGVCAAQAECDANRCVYRFPTLAWRDGQLRKKGAFGCEPLPRYRLCLRRTGLGRPPAEAIRQLGSAGLCRGTKPLDRRAQAARGKTVNHGGQERRRGFSETDCLPARRSSWCRQCLR